MRLWVSQAGACSMVGSVRLPDSLSQGPVAPALAPGLEHRHRHRVRKVQAALARPHRQAQALREGKALAQLRRQAARLGAEHEPVAGLQGQRVHQPAALRGERKHALGRRRAGVQQGLPVGMAAHVGPLVVVQPGAAHQAVFHRKPQRLHQVQGAAGVGSQADHVAGVGRNLGFDQDDVEHGGSGLFSAKGRRCGRKPGR